jgi:surface antigen
MKNVLYITFSLILIAIFYLAISNMSKPVFCEVKDCATKPLGANVINDKYGVINLPQDINSSTTIKISEMMASCNNERVRSVGADFDGYILITVEQNGSLVARSQMDFKTTPTKAEHQKVWLELNSKLGW